MICIAHRGARGYAPENTLAAIDVALEQGATWIEIDVRAHSGQVIVLHDEYLDRTTNGHGHIEHYSLNELRQLDAGNGQQIPLLNEAIELVNHRAKINIELKDANSAALVLALIEQYVSRGWQYQDFLVSGFFHHQLQWIKQQQPQCRIGALSAGVMLGYAEFAQQLNAWSINLCAQSINQQIIDDAHQRGLKVFVYTVNNHLQFDEFAAMGVDGLFTDYPERMLHWLDEQALSLPG
ncbi:glycerophosphodiester phosphodiesterase family protein [Psychrobium sp. 1_MG-2023]|uniref:glycerophosphodiester phosphodiesterase n=1 Tax=Psychrobium sp. 1_MG-2023 TaxID=3062624 RepID=UPI000C321437|nr:glycerophosphodiester phosphodiesterase family protein [Psychrobium sp. 1_MG-2023]MDP2562002.1 glycerophosphodiester phosphodiesterase family protein [Psychrobium sp. 1_MG-2023]PKF58616.1 glycerophosphodiester phosphodiesterase [Alteromonadales bacterium alter-6D02]